MTNEKIMTPNELYETTPEQRQACAKWLASLPTVDDLGLKPLDMAGLRTLDGLKAWEP